MKSFPLLSLCFSSLSLSLITVSRHEGFCSNDRSFSPFLCVCGFFSYMFLVVIACRTLVLALSLSLFSRRRIGTNGDGKQQSPIQHDHPNETPACTFSFVLVKWILARKKKEKTPMQQTTFSPNTKKNRGERKLKKTTTTKMQNYGQTSERTDHYCRH